jgi:glutamine synthetase
MGDMMKDGYPWEYCPRDFLKRMANDAEKNDLEIKGAFENEFYLLKKGDQGIEPVENTVFASTYSMDINQLLIGEIVNALLDQGMIVEQYYPESGPGQQEITVRFSNALRVCDNQIAFRETVRAMANKHGFLASFLPKIFPDKSGSGSHVHISLWQNGENILSELKNGYGLSETAGRFIAGILDHLPALMAITTPITNSYRRIIPHNWCGAYICWGIGNREAAIRIVSETDHKIRHFEFKTIDASSNPYLALGSIIAAGMDGLKNELELPPPVQLDPGYLSDDEMEKYKVKRLPSTLAEAISNLEKDDVIMDALGDNLSKAYLEVKKAEWNFMKDFSLDDEVKLLLEKY